MLPELTTKELPRTLDGVAAQILTAADVHAPPVDAIAVAMALGLAVAFDDQQQGRGRFVRLSVPAAKARGSILVRPEPRAERVQWSVAHEIGEDWAAEVFRRLGVDPREAPPGAREMVANHLASRLLLPASWFGAWAARRAWDLFQLKQRFATASHELIARRMLDFEPRIVITLLDHGWVTLRRSNFSRIPGPLTEAENRVWRAVHETAAPQVEANPMRPFRLAHSRGGLEAGNPPPSNSVPMRRLLKSLPSAHEAADDQ